MHKKLNTAWRKILLFPKLICISIFLGIMALLFLASCATNTDNIKQQPQTLVPSLPPQPKDAAAININLGLYYLKQQNIQEAKTKLLLALNQNPKNFLAYDAIAYFLETTKDIKTAEKYYTKAIALASADKIATARNNYGTFLYRQHRCQKALSQFIDAATDTKYLNIAAAYENAGFAALCLSNKYLAKTYFSRALAIEPKREKSKKELNKIVSSNLHNP